MIEARIAVYGVSLAQYAIVLAGRDDKLPIAEVLALAEIDVNSWSRAEHAWGQRILGDIQASGSLAAELAREIVTAQRRWSRPLPPLDEDLRAYLDFERAWAEEPDGDAFLADRGMWRADITRLDALWSERLAADPSMKARAVEILCAAPGPPPQAVPRPATLPRSAP